MSFLYLLLGHLLGDFVLQTDKIADNKQKSWQWNLLHAIIVSFCILIFSVPFGLSILLVVFINGGLHYLIDFYKPRVFAKVPLPELVYFLADQFLHISILYLISLAANNDITTAYFSTQTCEILIVMAFVSSFCAVLNQYVLKLLSPGSRKKFFVQDEKGFGNTVRIFFTFGIYISYTLSPFFLMFMVPVLAVIVKKYRKKWCEWMSVRHFTLKIFVDVAASLVGVVILIRL